MKKILPAYLLLLFVTISSVYAGQKNYADYDKTEHGLIYKIYKHGAGAVKAQVGDYIELYIQQVYTEGDTILSDSRKMNDNKPAPYRIQKPPFDGDINEGFTYMKEGDSAVFAVPIDTLIKKIPGFPPFFKSGYYLEFRVVMVSIKTEEQMKKEQEEKSAKQTEIDEKLLQDYFAKNGLKPEKTKSGVYYVMHKKGTGDVPKAGQKVVVKYTGKLLNGTVFDSDVDTAFHHTDPLFSFVFGQHGVIPGWEDGMANMNKGSKATLYIPSKLAYGDRSPAPIIPANSVMVFDVEIASIETDQMTPATPMNTKPTTPVKTEGRKMNTTKQKN